MSQAKPTMFSVFRSRPFTFLWAGQLISAMGSSLTLLAASVLIYRETGSALSVGLMLIATSGPTIVVGLFAGVFVDRSDRKRILIFSDVLRAILIFLIPFLIPLNIAWLYIVVALSSSLTQFFDSAHASVLPEIASDDELSAANAFMAVSSVGSTMFGFAAAGFIVSKLSVEWAFFIDAGSFVVSAVLVSLARLPAMPKLEDTSIYAIFHNLKEGLHVVRDVRILTSLFTIFGPAFFLFGLQNALLLPFALSALKATEFEFGLQQAAEAVGVALGSLVMARLADRLREGQWLVISFVLMGISAVFFSLSSYIGIAIFLNAVIGFANAPSFIGRQLVIQRSTPREVRGRVNSSLFVMRDVMFVTGMASAGLADLWDVRMMMLVSSIALVLIGLIAQFLPGLGQPVAHWKRTIPLLRGVEAAPRLGMGKPATRLEVDRFVSKIPELAQMPEKERTRLVADTLVAEAKPGMVVVYRGETSDSAYFILKGSVGVGYITDTEYSIVNYLHEGDFFGEVAALTGALRTANVITEEQSEFLIIPSKVMKRLANNYAQLREILYSTMSERLSSIELPRSISLDQNLLRELRIKSPDIEQVNSA